MKVKNKTKGDLGIAPDVVVPAGGIIELTADQVKEAKKSKVVGSWFEDGKLAIMREKQPAKEPAKEPAKQ